VTVKNAVFWDTKTQFVPHRRHITSPITDISEERIAFIMRIEVICSSETSVLTRAHDVTSQKSAFFKIHAHSRMNRYGGEYVLTDADVTIVLIVPLNARGARFPFRRKSSGG
jgi:hypothetical protein